MKRVKILVSGRVQRVGYRDRVAEIARNLGLKGTVYNLEDDVSVEIIAEGDEKQLEEFVKLVNIQDSPVHVEKLDVSYEDPTDEFKYFKIRRGEPTEELGERLDVAGTLLYSVDKKLDKMNDNLGKKIDKTNENTNKTNEKLDSFSNATMNRFDTVDTKYGKISTHMQEFIDLFRATFKPKE